MGFERTVVAKPGCNVFCLLASTLIILKHVFCQPLTHESFGQIAGVYARSKQIGAVLAQHWEPCPEFCRIGGFRFCNLKLLNDRLRRDKARTEGRLQLKLWIDRTYERVIAHHDLIRSASEHRRSRHCHVWNKYPNVVKL